MHWRDIIRTPIVTEKSGYQATELDQYAFVVDARANKIQIKEAVEKAFDVVVAVSYTHLTLPTILLV